MRSEKELLCRVPITVEDLAESFAIGKPARTQAIELAVHMNKRKRRGENVLVTTIFNTVSK